jgi:hypothetical protein
MDPNHRLLDYSEGLNHTAMLFIFVPFIIYFRESLRVLRKLAKCFNMLREIKGITIDWKIEVSVNENLGNYWNCIPGISQIKMCTQEYYCRKVLKFKTMDDHGLHHSRVSKRLNKRIDNETNYDILDNKRYVDQFFYQHLGRRINNENQSSDFVLSALWLGEEGLLQKSGRNES